jgi:hypothetical protein
MRADEALLLKCYDSKTDGRARFAPHTAFTDPTTPADVPPRESIELRTLVFHPAWCTPDEKGVAMKLIGWSRDIAIALLVVLTLVNRYIPATF